MARSHGWFGSVRSAVGGVLCGPRSRTALLSDRVDPNRLLYGRIRRVNGRVIARVNRSPGRRRWRRICSIERMREKESDRERERWRDRGISCGTVANGGVDRSVFVTLGERRRGRLPTRTQSDSADPWAHHRRLALHDLGVVEQTIRCSGHLSRLTALAHCAICWPVLCKVYCKNKRPLRTQCTFPRSLPAAGSKRPLVGGNGRSDYA